MSGPAATEERPTSPSGRLARLVQRLVPRSADAVEAAELRSSAVEAGATSVADCRPGERVLVVGTVRSVTLHPRSGTPALEAELYDGTGRIVLVWLGRRRIGGVEPGRRLAAHGRVTSTGPGDELVIFNPRYDLRPRGA